MDKAERDFIWENMPELVEMTTCSGALLSHVQAKKLMTKDEGHKIEQIGKTSSAGDAAKQFYETMMMKTDGFNTLMLALDAVRQTGALAILQKLKPMVPEVAAGASPGAIANYRSLVIGEGCEIDKITDIIRDAGGAVYQGKWRELAKKLKIPTTTIKKWDSKILIGTTDEFTVLDDMLEEWHTTLGDAATLGVLIDIFTGLNWINIAQKLEKHSW